MRPISFEMLVGSLLFATAPAIAQTTAPGSAAPATTGGGMGWLWFVLLLVIVGAAVWYFAFARNKPAGTRSMFGATGSPAPDTSSMGIDRDRIAGSAQQAKGSIKEGVGSVLGDAKLQAEGKLDKAEGKAQNTVGGIKDTLKGR